MHSKPVRPLVDNGDGTHTVILTRGKVALVDSADAAFVGQWNWCAWVCPQGGWYALRTDRETGATARMHRVLAGVPPGVEVDHVDRDSLNNRRKNIRVATRAQNNRNRGRQRNNTSGYKGVTWYARHKQWGAKISAGGRSHFLGLYRDAEDAHRAYCEAAARLHGEFANPG
jgi:hypothetical protein